MSTDPIKHEPAADLREMAAALYGMFVALVDQGFTEQQALVIIGQVIAANTGNTSA